MSSPVKVRFLIDGEQKRVVFAEAGSDFVDVLFSFLTLPLGSIVRLLNKKSGLGSLDSLYNSAEWLDAKYFQTEACKDMLLNPRSAAAELCGNLKIKGIHEQDPRRHYTCKQYNCLIKSPCYYTFTSNCLCSSCGELMDKSWRWPQETLEKGGVFVNETTEFLITDDLRVIPTSLSKGFSLLEEMQVKGSRMLEERVIDFGKEEILNFLRRSLVSKKVLTDVCFPDGCMQASVGFCKYNNISYVEVGADFINMVFSFLAYPLGSVLQLDNLSLGSGINNLYSSANSMGLYYFKSKIYKDILVAPKISTFYGYKYQMLGVKEITSRKSISCMNCSIKYGYKMRSTTCVHGKSEEIELNPKSAKGVSNNDRAFVAGSRRFMITDDLHISVLSAVSAVSAITNGKKLPIPDQVGKEVFVDKYKARSLLSAVLTSKTVLTDIFAPKPIKCERRNASTKACVKDISLLTGMWHAAIKFFTSLGVACFRPRDNVEEKMLLFT